jgi:dihydroorotate dehydrogenase electron transfer subunit
MDDFEGRISENRRIAGPYYLLTVELSKPMERVLPGQFVMLRVPGNEVFLRRPFSIYRWSGQSVGIMYRVAGKGTEALSKTPPGERTMVLGPLGNGFRIAERGTHLLVAGGIGIAGVNLLAEKLGERAALLFGCTGKEETTLVDGLPDSLTMVSTLDGSYGFQGNVIDLLSEKLREVPRGNMAIYACGPLGMFRALRSLIEEERLPCQVLMEERMACGLGLCFGCVTKTIDGKEPYKRVCKEGPVFDLWDLSL